MRWLAVTVIVLSACQSSTLTEEASAQPAVAEAAVPAAQAVESARPTACVDVTERQSFGPSSGNSRVVCLLDADGDGALDAFVGAFGAADALYWNDGSGMLLPGPSGSVGRSAGSTFGAAAADLDGDGRTDLFEVRSDGETNVLHHNLGGRQGFEASDGGSATQPAADAYGAASADVDLDGDADLIVVNRGAHNELHLNDGSGVFSAAPSGPLNSQGGNSRAVTTGDLDGDGDADVVIANWGDNAHAIYMNQGGAQGGQVASFDQDQGAEIARLSAKSGGLALADLDGDGDLDLAFSHRKGETNEVWLNDGAGVFTASSEALPAGDGGNSTDVAAVDLNRDGSADLLILNRQSAPYLYLNDGSASFTACTTVPLAQQALEATSCAWGDLKGDGGLDLLIVDALGTDWHLRVGAK
ncbi:MAG: hypothetical protein ACI9EF_002865 [Pseudohongiellaceae bacterium]|jgi:hypothetical protein